MRILHLSDTHGCHHRLKDLPEADVIVHSGDEQLLAKITEIHPHLHLFGHIHAQHGITTQHGIIFSSGAIMNADYTNLATPNLITV